MNTELPKLSAPAHRALAQAGITKLEDLTKISEAQLKKWHGIGPSSVKQLRAALAELGLSFAQK